MSTPDQPLTRKQMRELGRTGSVPVQTDASDESAQSAPAPAAPLPRAAVPVPVAALPTPDAQVDLGVAPLTRRQAREQERIRTASVPVITPDLAADAGAEAVGDRESADAEDVDVASAHEDEPADGEAEEEPAVDATGSDSAPEPTAEPLPEPVPVSAATVSPQFGAELLSGDEVAATLPPSFDELIARGGTSTGTLATPSALILSQTPSAPPLSGPVNATGEVIITGSYHLPEGLGSRGSVPSSTDGKDVDAVLIDGELPPASSPTPIAASAAISTVRGTGEIIRPPAPEKGSRLLFTLAITAGVLALALVGVLIIAVVNGAF